MNQSLLRAAGGALLCFWVLMTFYGAEHGILSSAMTLATALQVWHKLFLFSKDSLCATFPKAKHHIGEQIPTIMHAARAIQ